ncbi:MAG: hypothetical protein HN732_12665 [Rhodospirillaceae bacterium]|nr:hypothetical protein [Rhodospirillaceae bacterium]
MNEQPKQFKWVGTRTIRPDGVDKVTGRAMYGADLVLPGMLQGKVVRSPHAHARIKSIDTSKAEALTGVRAVITAADMPLADPTPVAAGEAMINLRDLSENVIAREKVLYEGQTVAAVAANTVEIAEQAVA